MGNAQSSPRALKPAKIEGCVETERLPTQGIVTPKGMKTSNIGLFLSTFGESIDVGVFGYLESQIQDNFFPNSRALTWFAFGAAFLVRPIAGPIVGWAGDRYGRKTVAYYSAVTLAMATFGQACLPGMLWGGPTLQPFGTVAFVGLRLAIGVAASGGGASGVTYICETVPKEEQTEAAGYLEGLSNLAYAAAAAIVFFTSESMSERDLNVWGWRAIIAISSAPSWIAILMLEDMEESSLQQKEGQQGSISNSFTTLTSEYARESFVGMAFLLPASAIWYQSVFAVDTYKRVHHLSVGMACLLAVVLETLSCYGCWWVGKLAQKIGVKPVLNLGTVFAVGLPFPMVYLISDAHKYVGLLAIGGYAILQSFTGGLVFYYLNQLYPTNIRMFASSTLYNIAVGIGGMSPFFVDLLEQRSKYAPAFYICLCGLIAVPAALSTTPVLEEREEGGKPPPETG